MPIAKLSTGIDLYYESYGRGEAIVFIPGTGFAENVWIESQAQELARSHQVIVHDPRGCGRSTHAKGVYTIDVMGNDVVALLEHLGLPHAHVIGHSMGGRIGLSIALNFPGKVKSLMIAAGGSGPARNAGSRQGLKRSVFAHDHRTAARVFKEAYDGTGYFSKSHGVLL